MEKPNKWVFIAFVLAALFLYFYRYPKMVAFDADQEFYAGEYLKAVQEHKLTLLGIETSTGGLFVGPLYTYLNIFVYWLFKGDAGGIFLFTLIFSSFQAGLTYFLFAKLKGKYIGTIAGFITLLSAALWNKAFAPSAINFLYLFGLFFFYALVRVKEDSKYFLWLGAILALALQIHFSLFFFSPIFIIFLFWQKLIKKENLKYYLSILGMILISLLPLVIFEARHNLFISKNFIKFISASTGTPKDPIGVFQGMVALFSHILTPSAGVLVYIFLAGVLIFFITKIRKDYAARATLFIFAVSILLFIAYNGPKPDYFFYFLLAPFFLIVSEFILVLVKNRLLRWPVFLSLFYLSFQNLQFMNTAINHYNYFLKKQVAEYIRKESQGKKVKISYDTDLGLAFGFDYLLKYAGVNMDNNNFEENYHIVMRNYPDYPGKEFREAGSPVSIKVVKLSKTI